MVGFTGLIHRLFRWICLLTSCAFVFSERTLRSTVSFAENYPDAFNLSLAQTKYHLSRPISLSFVCNGSSSGGGLKYGQSHIHSTSDLSNCQCASVPIGTSAYTDWALLLPCLFQISKTKPPRTVFVQTALLPFFADQVLPVLPRGPPFVLISGGMDLTIPRQLDSRYKPLDGFSGDRELFHRILNSSRVLRWYAENRDVSDGYSKFFTWPTGLSFARLIYPDDMGDLIAVRRKAGFVPVNQRDLKVLVSDRLHKDNDQMHLRREVRALCNRTPTCKVPDTDTNVEHQTFLTDISKVSFVACIQGGGVDPSPKAWETILAGSIPIIKSSWLDDAYRQLPVVLVEDWDQVFFSEALVDKLYPRYFARLNSGSLGMMASSERAANDTLYEEARRVYEERLEKWRLQLAPYYEAHSGKRREVLRRLQSAYWMNQVYNALDKFDTRNGTAREFAVERRAQFHKAFEEGMTHSGDAVKPEHSAGREMPVVLAVAATRREYPPVVPPGFDSPVSSSFSRVEKNVVYVGDTASHEAKRPAKQTSSSSKETAADESGMPEPDFTLDAAPTAEGDGKRGSKGSSSKTTAAKKKSASSADESSRSSAAPEVTKASRTSSTKKSSKGAKSTSTAKSSEVASSPEAIQPPNTPTKKISDEPEDEEPDRQRPLKSPSSSRSSASSSSSPSSSSAVDQKAVPSKTLPRKRSPYVPGSSSPKTLIISRLIDWQSKSSSKPKPKPMPR